MLRSFGVALFSKTIFERAQSDWIDWARQRAAEAARRGDGTHERRKMVSGGVGTAARSAMLMAGPAYTTAGGSSGGMRVGSDAPENGRVGRWLRFRVSVHDALLASGRERQHHAAALSARAQHAAMPPPPVPCRAAGRVCLGGFFCCAISPGLHAISLLVKASESHHRTPRRRFVSLAASELSGHVSSLARVPRWGEKAETGSPLRHAKHRYNRLQRL